MNNNLPNNWILKTLGEVVTTSKGKKPKNSGPPSDERAVPYINIKAFESGQPTEFAEVGNYTNCDRDDVLIVWDGARSGLIGRGVAGYIGSTLAKVDSDIADNGYLFYFLLSQYGHINTQTKGVGIPHVDPTIFKAIPFPIAPLEQQKRIVAEIEKQFSRLDEAVSNLKRVKANLKRYKAAVLKAAVEGKLTEEWRKQHPDVEPASNLLERILTERRQKWEEAELAKMKAKGKVPKDDKWKKKYKDPTATDTTNIPALPNGWCWASIEQLTWLVTSGSRGWGKFYSDTGVLFIRAQDIKTDDLNLDSVVRVDVPADAEGTRSSVGMDDILVTITGANVTKSALVEALTEQAFVSQHVALLKLNDPLTASYIYSWIVSPSNGRKNLEALAYGAGKPGLSLEQLRALTLPFPPLEEQYHIIAEVERSLSLVREIEDQVDSNLKRAERMRQSILSSAFSGRLTQMEA